MKMDSSWDNVWDDVFANQEWGKYPSESLIQFIARNYYKLDRKTVRILEVGCGTGANVWFVAREGFAAYGIDGSAIAINKAAKRMSDEGIGNVSLVVGDIIKLPYEDNFFDAVIDNECIYSNNKSTQARRKII
jgi:ubiquinone/menaquinone biosynthesis C-methylase UbiE